MARELTVGELRAELAGHPDHYPVFVGRRGASEVRQATEWQRTPGEMADARSGRRAGSEPVIVVVIE